MESDREGICGPCRDSFEETGRAVCEVCGARRALQPGRRCPSCPPLPAYFDSARAGRFRSQGIELAVLGMIQQDLARDYKLRQAVWVAEINF